MVNLCTTDEFLCHDDQMVAERTSGADEPVRVVVVDDQELFRRGLTMLLGVEPGIEVVGEAGDGISATDLVVATVSRFEFGNRERGCDGEG